MKKEKNLSELNLTLALIKNKIRTFKADQEMNREDLKFVKKCYAEGNLEAESIIRDIEVDIIEKRILLNGLQQVCIKIKKNIKKLDKEQNFRNKKN
jgi:hypothetical protein